MQQRLLTGFISSLRPKLSELRTVSGVFLRTSVSILLAALLFVIQSSRAEDISAQNLEHLSKSARWLALLHYQKQLLGTDYISLADNESFFSRS